MKSQSNNTQNHLNQHIGYVLKSNNNLIRVIIADDVLKPSSEEKYTQQQVYEREKNAGRLQIGDYLKIAQGNTDFVVATIVNIDGTIIESDNARNWNFVLDCQPIGSLNEMGEFRRGGALLPVPLEPVYVMDKETVSNIFVQSDDYKFKFGKLSMNEDVDVFVNGDKFFSKHIAVVGSTGSGKSCTVAKILHEVAGITEDAKNVNKDARKNSHIVIFDIHSEYESAFKLEDEQKFTLNTLSVDNLALPYWLMNSEELESLFIESNEENSHNQVSQFKKAVIENKKIHNSTIAASVTYDTPVYFSIIEVKNYIENLNNEIIRVRTGNPEIEVEEGDNIDVTDRTQYYFKKVQTFIENNNSRTQDTATTTGPFYGKFLRFILRLETRLSDSRLDFLLTPQKKDGSEYKTADFRNVLKQYIGYLDVANVTIVDLSGIPFEVLSICISLISRIIFDFCFHYTKLQHTKDNLSDVPVMIVCEEAHNYVPQNDTVAYRPSRKSIERIAKEGRKYGLSLMVVSQRPSEVSETIFAQCSNFVTLRLTNINDQRYVTRLVPDSLSSITDTLPNLGDGECIVIGDAIPLPSVIQMEMPNPAPKSESVKFHTEWLKDWIEPTFDDVIDRWRKY